MKRVILLFLGCLALLFAFNGARTAAAGSTINVTTTNDLIAADGFCSLREAIISANENNSPGIIIGECPDGSASVTDVIQIQGGVTYNLSIDGAGEDAAATGDLDVLDNPTPDVDVRIVAVGGSMGKIENSGMSDRLFHIIGAGFELENIELTGGVSTMGGALLNAGGEVSILETIFSLNSAASGGAIFNQGSEAQLTMELTEITRNTTSFPGDGAGILNIDGTVVAIDSLISGNIGPGPGGGLLNRDGSATLVRTRVAGNQSGDCGGGLANLGTGVMTLTTSEVTGVNQADGPGGGICNEATLSVTVGSIVSSNEAKAGGGGIFNDGSLTLRNSAVGLNHALDPDNDSDGIGGGIYGVAGSTATVTQSAIVQNDAATSGGGILMDGQLLMFNTTVSDNFSLLTGGIVITENGSANLVNVTVSENEGTSLTGQGLHVLEGSLALGNTIVSAMDQAAASCTNVNGTVNSLGHNLGDDDTCFGDASDITNADPLLGELDAIARLPLPGSPAVNAADPVLCSETAVGSVDQLGQARPAFAGCDIGAIEWQGLQIYLPTIKR